MDCHKTGTRYCPECGIELEFSANSCQSCGIRTEDLVIKKKRGR